MDRHAATSADGIAHAWGQLRTKPPLVLCITNYVSMDIAANLLNAAGASPAMVHDPTEVGEFAGMADSVMVNIGTPSPAWSDGMTIAAATAHEAGTPWVLDPVAVGATSYRRGLVARLLAHQPTIIRGNAGEIAALAGVADSSRGVDSTTDAGQAGELAGDVARRQECVVAMTGATDLVTDGARRTTAHGGDRRTVLITAFGCAVTALTAACAARHQDATTAATAGLIAASVAAERAGAGASGPGSLRWRLLDELSTLDQDAVREGAHRLLTASDTRR